MGMVGVLAVIIPATALMLLSLLLSLAFLRNNVDADARERPRAGRSRRTRPEVTTTIACFLLTWVCCWLCHGEVVRSIVRCRRNEQARTAVRLDPNPGDWYRPQISKAQVTPDVMYVLGHCRWRPLQC